MKHSIVITISILAIIAFASADEWKLKTKDEWSQIHRTCDNQHNVPPELVKKARAEKYPPKPVFEVVLCILRSVGVWSDAKGFSTDRIMIGLEDVASRENLNRQFLRESIDRCRDGNSEGSSALDWAYRCFKCFIDNEQLFEAIRKVKLYQEDKSEEESE